MSFYKRVKKNMSEKAFENLVEKEKNKLYRIAFLYAKNENDALDIVQETIYKAFTSIDTLKKINYFSTWITRILINTSLDFLKGQKNIILSDKVDKIDNQNYEKTEDKIDLVDAIKRLEEPYKTVITLRFYKDFTIKQIASILDCPEGTVKTHIHRGIYKLKLALGKEYVKWNKIYPMLLKAK